MREFEKLTLQPILAVLIKLRIELDVNSKEKQAVDYALWDMVRHYHSCKGLIARQMIQLILNALYFIPGDYLMLKSKKDILAYALVPESETDVEDLLLLYRVKLNKGKDVEMRRVNFPTVTPNSTQTDITEPIMAVQVGQRKPDFDLRWVLKKAYET